MLRQLQESSSPATPNDVQATSFSYDVLGRYVCNTWDEAIPPGAPPYDVVVIGSGMYGAYCAEKLYRLGEDTGLRVLLLDAGSFLFTTHVQNLPRIGLGTGPMSTVASNAADPGPQNVVWGYPWHSNQAFPGIAYCVGGRSIFWGGWSPRLTNEDLAAWPSDVATYLQADYPRTETEIGVTKPVNYLTGALGTALKSAFNAAAPSLSVSIGDAPLAVQGIAPEGALFSFDKYSSADILIDAIREDIGLRWLANDNSRRRLVLVPHAQVVRLATSGGKVTGMDLLVNGVPQTLAFPQQLSDRCAVVVAASTIESTRLALASFPRDGMGANLMAHLRSNITVRIRRSAIPGLPATFSDLETAALIVRGSANVGTPPQARRFHLQVTAAASQGPNTEANLFTAIPDIDHFDQLRANQDPNWVAIVLRGIGEMSPDRGVAPPDGPKDPGKSWVNLAKSPGDFDARAGTPRAWVNLVKGPTEDALWALMDQTAIALARKIAGSDANIQYFYDGGWQSAPPGPAAIGQIRDGLGSTHHEAGTLWMGSDPASSVCDTFGRFHHVANAYVAGPALFPTLGSANPSLTGLTLARRTAEAVVASATPAPSAQPKALLTPSLTGWQMAGSGGFTVVGDAVESFGGIGLLWYTREVFEDFVLQVDWRAANPDDNSGVLFRFPALNSSDPGNDWRLASDRGYEIQIDDTGFDPVTNQHNEPSHRTGAVYALAPSTKLNSKPLGEWNSYLITVSGRRISVTLNGELVCDYTADGTRSPRGHIGLQNHHPGSRVQFRNLFVTRVTAGATSPAGPREMVTARR